MAADPDQSSPAGVSKTRPYAPRLAPDHRREQLLDASLQIAVRRGFSEITMGNVAKACGVTRPVVYSRTMVEEQRRRVIAEIEHFVLIAGEAMLPEPDLLSLVVVGMMERIATTMIAEPDRLEIDRVMAFAETVFDSLWGAAVQRATS